MNESLHKCDRFSGQINVPGDKSISHRALMLAGIAQGTCTIRGLATGKDVASTASCLKGLGVEITKSAPDTMCVRGAGEQGLTRPAAVLDAGNSGTTIRLLSGILAGQPFNSTITGDRYLCRRPMGRIIEPLQQMGAKISSADNGLPPLEIEGGILQGITYHLPVASAQVKSCVLLAGLFASGRTTVVEKVPSRDHTERMLPLLGVEVEKEGLSVSVEGGARLSATDINVPGDPSSAAFFAAAAAMVPGGRVRIDNLCLNPTRSAFFKTLARMGARIEKTNERIQAGEPVADLIVGKGELSGCTVDGAIVPSLIDEVPMLAVLATQANGVTAIRDAAELRVKETDRIRAVSENLSRMGARVREFPDGLEIEGPTQLQAARIETFGDHRIAMAFSVAALVASGETVIENAACADISFPNFYLTLRQLAGLS